jgi:predicted SnoaL-like aldol condensation-catalyzing enzyme
MTKATPEQNKALVLEAFDTLFNKRDYEAAARFWSDTYIQHSAHIEPGRDGLFSLIRSAPDTLRYEHQLIVAEGDYVIVHGRFSGTGRPVAWANTSRPAGRVSSCPPARTTSPIRSTAPALNADRPELRRWLASIAFGRAIALLFPGRPAAR